MQAAETRTPTQEGIVYGGRWADFDDGLLRAKGRGVHPIAIIIHGGGYHGGDSKSGSEAYVADFLAPAGYAVFSVNSGWRRSIPIRIWCSTWSARCGISGTTQRNGMGIRSRIALVGGSAGGFLSNMVGLLNAPGDPNAADPVDRESAKAQAVVSLYAQSSFEFVPLNADVHRLLDPLIAEKGEKEAIREASPITYVSKDDPPFLEILGDQDEYIPFPRRPTCRRPCTRLVCAATSSASPAANTAPGDGTSCPACPTGSDR